MLLRLIFFLASTLAVCGAGPTRRGNNGRKNYMIVMKPGHRTNEVQKEASAGATVPPETLDLQTVAAVVTDANIDVAAVTALPSVDSVEEVQMFSVDPTVFMTTALPVDTTPWAAKLAAAGDPSSTLLPPADSTVDWHLDRIDQRGLPLNLDYNVTQCGAGVDIYIVDTGIATALPEFEGRALPFYSPADGLTGDVYGHGTFVAALAAGKRHGVAKCATIYDVRVLGADGGGDTVDIVQGLDAVLRRPNRSRRAIVNMSLGGKGRSQIIEWYIAALLADNVLVVAAAGNSDTGDNACTYTPGASDSALTVGATDIADKMPVWSNTGACVKVLAPGVDVYSTTSDGTDQAWSGTSMASPIVAGGAALFWSDAASLTARQVFRAVLANGTPNLASTATASALPALPAGTPNLLLFVQFSVGRAPSAADVAAGIGGAPLTVCTGTGCGAWTFSVGVNANGILMRSTSGAALVRPFSWSGVQMSVYTMVGVTAYATSSLDTTLPGGLYFEGNNRMSIRGGGVRVVIDSMFFINDGVPRLYFRDNNGGTWSYANGALVQLTADQVLWLYSWRGLGVCVYVRVMAMACLPFCMACAPVISWVYVMLTAFPCTTRSSNLRAPPACFSTRAATASSTLTADTSEWACPALMYVFALVVHGGKGGTYLRASLAWQIDDSCDLSSFC